MKVKHVPADRTGGVVSTYSGIITLEGINTQMRGRETLRRIIFVWVDPWTCRERGIGGRARKGRHVSTDGTGMVVGMCSGVTMSRHYLRQAVHRSV